MKDKREALIQELKGLDFQHTNYDPGYSSWKSIAEGQYGNLADFILARERSMREEHEKDTSEAEVIFLKDKEIDKLEQENTRLKDTMGKVKEVLGKTYLVSNSVDSLDDCDAISKALAILNEAEGK